MDDLRGVSRLAGRAAELESSRATSTGAGIAWTTLEGLLEGGFAEYSEPFISEPLGPDDQSWTTAVALDWLAHGDAS